MIGSSTPIYLELPVRNNFHLMHGPAAHIPGLISFETEVACAALCEPEYQLVAVHHMGIQALARCAKLAGECALNVPEEAALWLRVWRRRWW